MNNKEFITAVAGYVDKYASAYGILVRSSVIAQAILEKPKLILLDEPTNGIDSDGIQMLEELLRCLKEAGSTIVVTSHDRDFLDAVTSQCYEMKEGSLR